MTTNPVPESASKTLLDYVEDTKFFATAINESIGASALLDEQCTFLREPTASEFVFVRAMLPAEGAARLLDAFDSAVEEQMQRMANPSFASVAEEM